MCWKLCRDVLHGGLVVVIGTQLHFLGSFLLTHVTRCCTYLHCVLDVIIYKFVPSRTFVTMVPFLSWTILLTTLCLHVVILFPLYLPHQQSTQGDILTLCVFALSGTNFPFLCWKLTIVTHFVMLLLNIFVILVKFSLAFCDLLHNVAFRHCVFVFVVFFCSWDSTLYRRKPFYCSFLYGKLIINKLIS